MGGVSWKMQRVAVVGSGAVGIYYGGKLARAGVDVRFLVRGGYEEVRQGGLRIESVRGDFELPAAAVCRSVEEIGPVDLVVVAWKATANCGLVRVLPPLVGEGTQVLTLQNGLGNCEAVASVVGGERVMGGLCFVCINRLAPGVVRHTAGGRVAVGEYQVRDRERVAEVVGRFREADIPAEEAVELGTAQWQKLVWNIPFNGLAVAEGGVTTDVLLASDAIEAEIRGLMAEVVAAGRALGHGLDDSLIDFNVERTRPMGAYRPSSLIDYMEGREVELSAIWEEPLRRAQAAGVAMPRLERLVGRMRERLDQRGPGGGCP